jgi:predicted GNAT family N-acyltransferase
MAGQREPRKPSLQSMLMNHPLAHEGFALTLVSWNTASDALSRVRRAVFIVEQGVPESLEWDDADAVSVHALASAPDGEPVATGRLLPDGHIGRMAVLKAWRGRGVGAAILALLVKQARGRGDREIALAAQVHAIGFYEREGFVAEGPVFDDAGLPHRRMVLRPAPATPAS